MTRDIHDVIDLILKKIPTDGSASEYRSRIDKFWNSISYRAPEMHLELGSWNDLHAILMDGMDEYHTKYWYCEVLSVFSTNPVDDIIKALQDKYGSNS
ncbi:MAG: hypothetical protein NC548_35440 [Lachnospiraceae bacterium]|nr:hypothetical protein [Lachnospiraceae bacterium]